MGSYKIITDRQLRDVVSDYHAAFPEWKVLDNTVLYRDCFPVRQTIWFQKLRTGAYRPMHSISALPCPISRMLPQMLDVHHREATFKQHAAKWPAIISAMEQQLKPDIRQPIEITDVLERCEEVARPESTNDLVMLAILRAWLGRDQAALSACEKAQATPAPAIASIHEWEGEMKAFARKLADAILTGGSRSFLLAEQR